jgi:hypothetical protein
MDKEQYYSDKTYISVLIIIMQTLSFIRTRYHRPFYIPLEKLPGKFYNAMYPEKTFVFNFHRPIKSPRSKKYQPVQNSQIN